ncbi:MAG: hypothetical protein IVW52_21210, partial [Acidimicrobiales bacterium]|nr:hypothetical protein [Acidimicrobiales bacterium]
MLRAAAEALPGAATPARTSTVEPAVAFPGSGYRWLPDVIGLLWVVAAAVATLLPALIHGVALGPYDLLARSGLTSHPGIVPHNLVNSDQVSELAPWTTLSWRQVHQGHLPLWNPYSGLGMPLAFNWQSASFSVPTLVGYLFPLRLAFTAGILTTKVVAGTRAYVAGRTLGLLTA